MKLNNWSIVPSPTGISAKPLAQHNDIEVCVSIVNGKLRIGVHRDGQHAAMRVFNMEIKPRTPKKRGQYRIKPSAEALRSIAVWSAERALNMGNEALSWLYLFSAEMCIDEGESK